MRLALIILLFSLFVPSVAFAEEPLAVAILNLEADKVEVELAETLTSIVRNEALQVDKYQVVNKYPIRLSDIALLVGCSPESPTCLKQVASEVEARVLIYGLVRRQGEASYQIEINVFDVTNGKMLNRLTHTLTDTDPVAGFRKEIEAFFAEQRGQTTTSLQIGASVDGAQVRIDDAFVGVVPLERKGLAPGKYAIQVAHPDYQVWETVVELTPGSDQRVWAQLIPIPTSPHDQALSETTTEQIKTSADLRDTPLPPSPRGTPWGAWSAVSVGALALGGAVGFGIALESTESKLEKEAANGMLTEARYQELYDRGQNYELGHRILLGVGIVASATGLVWLIIDRVGERHASIGVTPSGVTARVRW